MEFQYNYVGEDPQYESQAAPPIITYQPTYLNCQVQNYHGEEYIVNEDVNQQMILETDMESNDVYIAQLPRGANPGQFQQYLYNQENPPVYLEAKHEKQILDRHQPEKPVPQRDVSAKASAKKVEEISPFMLYYNAEEKPAHFSEKFRKKSAQNSMSNNIKPTIIPVKSKRQNACCGGGAHDYKITSNVYTDMMKNSSDRKKLPEIPCRTEHSASDSDLSCEDNSVEKQETILTHRCPRVINHPGLAMEVLPPVIQVRPNWQQDGEEDSHKNYAAGIPVEYSQRSVPIITSQMMQQQYPHDSNSSTILMQDKALAKDELLVCKGHALTKHNGAIKKIIPVKALPSIIYKAPHIVIPKKNSTCSKIAEIKSLQQPSDRSVKFIKTYPKVSNLCLQNIASSTKPQLTGCKSAKTLYDSARLDTSGEPEILTKSIDRNYSIYRKKIFTRPHITIFKKSRYPVITNPMCIEKYAVSCRSSKPALNLIKNYRTTVSYV